MRCKTKYSNGQSRGGVPGKAVDSTCPSGRFPKDYHKQAVAFHGGEAAHTKWLEKGMKGYGRHNN